MFCTPKAITERENAHKSADIMPTIGRTSSWARKLTWAGAFIGLAVMSSAVAQNTNSGRIEVWRGAGPVPGLAFRTSALEAKMVQRPFQSADDLAFRAFERAAETSRQRLRDGGAWPSTQGAPSNPTNSDVLVQPVAGFNLAGLPLEVSFGVFTPPDAYRWIANRPMAATNWLRSFTNKVTPPSGRTTAFDEPNMAVAYAMSEHAVARMVLPKIGAAQLRQDADFNALDSVGSAFFTGAQFALTGYVLEGLQPRQPATSSDGYTLFDLAVSADKVGTGTGVNGVRAFKSEAGVAGLKLLGIGAGWSKSWSGLADRDSAGASASAPVTGVMRSLMANSGPKAVRHMVEGDWPTGAAGNSAPDAKAWLAWADTRLRSAPYDTPWPSATPIIHELGFAASYTAALADLIALPDRIADAGGNRAIPKAFADGVHISHAFAHAPCQKLEINITTAVREVELELPEIAARCIQLVWTGPTYGPQKTVPTLLMSAKTDSCDIADLKLATSMNSHMGLVVESVQTNEAVKTWSLPFKPDLAADGQTGTMTTTMTLGLVAIAPNAVDTKPMNVKLTLGMGVVETTGAISANVDVASPEQECNMQPIASPGFIGPVPAIVALGGGGDDGDTLSFKMGSLDGLFGLSLASNRSDLDKVVPAMGCIGSPQGGGRASLAASRAFQRRTPQSSSDPEGGFCTEESARYNEYLSQQTRNPPRSVREMSITPKDGASLSGLTIGVDATAKLLDPAKPENARTVDVDMEGTVTFSIRTATRLKGTISLRTKQTDETSCPSNPRGSLQTSFDVVAVLPLMSNVSVREINWMEMMDPLLWRIMTPSQKEAAKAAAQESAAQARRERATSTAASTVAPLGGQCTCECDEFNDPERREACGSQCLYYGPISARCVQDRERARGVPDDTIIQTLNQCPTTCAQFATRGNQLCDDAFWFISRTCKATTNQSGFVTPEQEKCWIDLSTDSMTGAQGAEYRAMLARQLAEMDQQGKVLLIIPSLEALAKEGKRCP
jgi:hypothetical protein